MNRDELRNYFWEVKALTYDDVKLEDLRLLEIILNVKFANQNLERFLNNEPTYWINVNKAKYYKGTYNDDRTLQCAFMTGRGGYFTAREVISFSLNKRIVFCNEADDSNLKPVADAFVEWCDILAKTRKGDPDV